MCKQVEIRKDDIKPLLYFIIVMFQEEQIHRQGTSAKSDLLGGFIDRWINKIPEELIFNKLLLIDKSYVVINDYFIYGEQSEKNAPDILGLKVGEKVIKFVEYETDKWVQVEDMPYIEIKTFKKNQKLVSVKSTQLNDNKYYVFVESDISVDYLINFLKKSCINEKVRKKIQMDKSFIKDNSKGIITQPGKITVNKDELLGTLSLIRIMKGEDFKKRATLCAESENVLYLKNIKEVSKVTGKKYEEYFKDIFIYNEELDMYSGKWDGQKIIAMTAENIHDLKILKKNKKSFYCKASENCSIYNYKLKANVYYKVDLELFERSSKWKEYVALKNQFSANLDKADELVNLLDNIAKNKR